MVSTKRTCFSGSSTRMRRSALGLGVEVDFSSACNGKSGASLPSFESGVMVDLVGLVGLN